MRRLALPLLVPLALLAGGCPEDPPPAPQDASRYLEDPKIAAQPGDVAAHPPWEKMGRYRVPDKLFEGQPPAARRIADLCCPGPETRAIEALLHAGRARPALAQTERLLEKQPANDLARYLHARAAQALGRSDLALEVYGQVIERVPGLTKAYVERGTLRSDLYRHDDALADLDRALDLEPTWEGHLERGIILCFAQRFGEAEWDLWKAVAGNPGDGNAYYDLAWVYTQRKQVGPTIEMLRFAARDEKLFRVRMSREVLDNDSFFKPLWEDRAFQAYAARLPAKTLDPEPEYRELLKSTAKHLKP